MNRLDFLMYICTRENKCSLSLSVIEVSPQSKTWVLTIFKLHILHTLLKSSSLALAYLTQEKNNDMCLQFVHMYTRGYL